MNFLFIAAILLSPPDRTCKVTINRVPDPNPDTYRMTYTVCPGARSVVIFRLPNHAEVRPQFGPGQNEIFFVDSPGEFDVHVCLGRYFSYHRAIIE